jgi:hypothetical protein
MMRKLCLRGTAALVALALAGPLTSAAPTPAEKSRLNWVPATAPLVLYLHGAERTKDRVVAFLKNALPDVAPMVQGQLETWLKDGVDGRKLAGLPKDGPIFVVFTEMPKPRTEPKVAVLIAVTNYADFRDNLLKESERKALKKDDAGVESTTMEFGETIYFLNKKDFAVATPSKEVAAAFAKGGEGITAKISKEQADKFLESDLGLYLSMDTVNKAYGDEIKAAREQVETGLKQVEQSVGKTQQSIMEMVKKAIGPVFQAIEDSQGVLLTLEVRPTAAALHAQTEVREGSATAKALKEAQPSAFPELTRLPAGRLTYTGIHTSPMMYDFLGPLLFGALPDPDGKGAKEVQAAVAELIKAGPGDRVDGMSMPPAGLSIWKYKDPAKAVEGQLKLLQAMEAGATLQSGYLKEKPEIKEKAQKYGDFQLTSVHLVWDFDKMLEASTGGQALPEEAKKKFTEAMQGMMGQDMRYWFGTDGKVFVQATAKDWPSAQKMLDQYFKGQDTIGSQEGFRLARKELPERASMLMVVDVVQYAGFLVDFVKNLAPLPLPPFAPPAKDKANFGGMAFTLQPRGGSVDFAITAPAVNDFYTTYVKPLLQQLKRP